MHMKPRAPVDTPRARGAGLKPRCYFVTSDGQCLNEAKHERNGYCYCDEHAATVDLHAAVSDLLEACGLSQDSDAFRRHGVSVENRLRRLTDPGDPDHPQELTLRAPASLSHDLNARADEIETLRLRLPPEMFTLSASRAQALLNRLDGATRAARHLAAAASELSHQGRSAMNNDLIVLELARCWRMLKGEWPAASAHPNDGRDTGPFPLWVRRTLARLAITHPAVSPGGEHWSEARAAIKDAVRRLRRKQLWQDVPGIPVERAGPAGEE